MNWYEDQPVFYMGREFRIFGFTVKDMVLHAEICIDGGQNLPDDWTPAEEYTVPLGLLSARQLSAVS